MSRTSASPKRQAPNERAGERGDSTDVAAADQARNEVPAGCLISAISYEGLSVTTIDGRRATLAVIDSDGRVIASGRNVELAAWEAAVKAYRDFLMGRGHLRTLVKPP